MVVPNMNPIYQNNNLFRPNYNGDLSKLPKNGSFETDIPKEIVKAKFVGGRLFCTVLWEKRPN